MIVRVLLVFHRDGRLYFSSQAPEAFEDVKQWERKGYFVQDLTLNI